MPLQERPGRERIRALNRELLRRLVVLMLEFFVFSAGYIALYSKLVRDRGAPAAARRPE